MAPRPSSPRIWKRPSWVSGASVILEDLLEEALGREEHVLDRHFLPGLQHVGLLERRLLAEADLDLVAARPQLQARDRRDVAAELAVHVHLPLRRNLERHHG